MGQATRLVSLSLFSLTHPAVKETASSEKRKAHKRSVYYLEDERREGLAVKIEAVDDPQQLLCVAPDLDDRRLNKVTPCPRTTRN